VMAIGLAVGGDVNELRSFTVAVKSCEQPVGEVFAARQESFEGDGARDGAVVKEERDGPAGSEPLNVRNFRIDASTADIGPVAVVERAHELGLIGRQNREANAVLGQD